MGMTVDSADLFATSSELLATASHIAGAWKDEDATGSFLARNLRTGEQFGFDITTPMPLASVAKVPLALVVLDTIDSGEIDGATMLTVDPSMSAVGSTGITILRHPVTMAVVDLVQQMLAVSDNAAADALLDLIGIDAVSAWLQRSHVENIDFRHNFARMFDVALGAAGNDFTLAREMAVREDAAAGRYAIETLDPAKANTATALALVDLLHRVWSDDIANVRVTEQLRRMMSHQVFSQRLASDLRTDSFRISSKTGSFLNLRHEIGVVETDYGDQIAIAALTRSSIPAMTQQNIDLAIGAAARLAVEALR